jgi:SAM-dependent methyltransferase
VQLRQSPRLIVGRSCDRDCCADVRTLHGRQCIENGDNALEEQVYDELYALEDTHWWFRGRRAVIGALLDRADLGATPRLLDAGCGTGRNLIDLASMGEASGVDGSELAVKYCRERGLADVQQSLLGDLPFESGTFDGILLADVIEHVEDDAEALRELRRVARPGARLVLTTPAYSWLWSRQDEQHHHFRRYTRPEIVSSLREAGWEPDLATYFNAALLPPIAAVRKLGRRFVKEDTLDTDLTPGPLNGALSLPMRGEARLIRAGVRLPFGVSIGVLASAAPAGSRS